MIYAKSILQHPSQYINVISEYSFQKVFIIKEGKNNSLFAQTVDKVFDIFKGVG